jgi:hypothetical protein
MENRQHDQFHVCICFENASVRMARFSTFKAESFEHGDRAAAHVPLPRITMSKSPPLARISIMPETQHRPQAVARRAAWAGCIGALAGAVKHKNTQEIVIFFGACGLTWRIAQTWPNRPARPQPIWVRHGSNTRGDFAGTRFPSRSPGSSRQRPGRKRPRMRGPYPRVLRPPRRRKGVPP